LSTNLSTMPRGSSKILAGALLLAAFVGCGEPAAGPQLGVRRRYDDVTVERQADVMEAGRVRLDSPSLTAGISGRGPLKLAEIEAWLADEKNHEPLAFLLPVGLRGEEEHVVLPSGGLTRARIELGRQLFFDRRLSKDARGFSCGRCHAP